MYSTLLNMALPLLLRATRSRYWALARAIRQRQYWRQSQMADWQSEHLRKLVGHACEKVAFYRQRMKELGIAPADIQSLDDLPLLPATTKEDIQRHFPDAMTAHSGNDPDWRTVGTRGTTNRLMVIHDFLRRDHARATTMVVLTEDCAYRLGMRQVAIPPDACSAVCGLDGLRETSVLRQLAKTVVGRKLRDPAALSDLRGLVMNNWVERATILPPLHEDGPLGDARVAECVQRIKTAKPALLLALPEYLRALARYVKRSGDRLPSIPVIRPMGANLDAVSRHQIEAELGGRVREHYGSLELGGIAFDCAQRSGLHVLSDEFIVEVVRNGRRVENGEKGSVLITDLHNITMPLIRYQIGDVGWLDSRPCECGRNSPRLHLEGRLEDTIVRADGVLITPEVMSCLLYAQDAIDDFQLIESNPGQYELRCSVLPQGHCNLMELERACRQALGPQVRIKVRQVRSILPESSGKFRHCKSASYHRLVEAPQALPSRALS